ncbi:MAG: ester cyclase [Thermoproteota archaeon]|nr:ester cyclase [Thermoproteota archaeon]
MPSSQEEQNKQVVRQVFEFYNQQDIEKVQKLFSPKHIFHFPGAPPMDWNSHKQFIVGLSKAFPDLHFKVEDILAEGDKVAYRLTVSGTHKGEFQGIPPTNKKVSFTSTGISNIVDGKVAEDWVDADTMGLMQQIGAIPSSAPSSGTTSSGTHS